MTAWAVADGYQVNHEGIVYGPAEPLPDLPAEVAEKWQIAGYIEPAPAPDTKPADRPASTA